MQGAIRFIKTTLVGGVLFLVPVVIMLAILGKAYQLAMKIVTPLLAMVPVAALNYPLALKLAGVVFLIFICFMAGILAGRKKARQATQWLEDNILVHVPGYLLLKSVTRSAAGIEDESLAKPVLARIEDAWQIGFLVEQLEGKHLAIYVPGAPNARSGSVYFMTEDRVRPLDVPLPKVMKCMRQLGGGSSGLLPKAVLTEQPAQG